MPSRPSGVGHAGVETLQGCRVCKGAVSYRYTSQSVPHKHRERKFLFAVSDARADAVLLQSILVPRVTDSAVISRRVRESGRDVWSSLNPAISTTRGTRLIMTGDASANPCNV